MRLLLFPLFFLAACQSDESDVDEARAAVQEAFLGTWRGDCAPQPDGSFGIAEFYAGPDQRGSFTYTVYGDDACTFRLASFTIDDEQHIGDPVPTVGEDVWELDLPYVGISATAWAEDFVSTLEQAGCGSGAIEVGTAFDISETGCFFFQPIEDCPGDYDIFRIEGDVYTNGVRETDMCTPAGRPSELNDFHFTRVD